MRDGDVEQASTWFNTALELDKDDPETWLIVARAYYRAGMPEKAETLIDKTMAFCKDRRKESFLISMAWMFAELEEPERAAIALSVAVQMDPKEEDYLLEWAAISVQLGDIDTAIEKIEAAIEIDSDVGTLVKANQIVNGSFVSFFTIVPVGAFPVIATSAKPNLTATERGRAFGLKIAERLFERSSRTMNRVWAASTFLKCSDLERAEACIQLVRKRGKRNSMAMSQLAVAYAEQGMQGKANEFADLAFKGAVESEDEKELLAAGWALSRLHKASDVSFVLIAMRNKARVGQGKYLKIAGMLVACGKTNSGLNLMREYLLKDANEELLYQLALELIEGVYRNRDLM